MESTVNTIKSYSICDAQFFNYKREILGGGGVCQMPFLLNTHPKIMCLRWLEIVFEIFSTRKRFTFIYIIAAFNVAK